MTDRDGKGINKVLTRDVKGFNGMGQMFENQMDNWLKPSEPEREHARINAVKAFVVGQKTQSSDVVAAESFGGHQGSGNHPGISKFALFIRQGADFLQEIVHKAISNQDLVRKSVGRHRMGV